MGRVRDLHQVTPEELARALWPNDRARLRYAATLSRRPAITGGGLSGKFKAELVTLTAALALVLGAVAALVWLGIFNY